MVLSPTAPRSEIEAWFRRYAPETEKPCAEMKRIGPKYLP
jgi:hypothetical protein